MDPIQNPYSNTGQMIPSQGWQGNPNMAPNAGHPIGISQQPQQQPQQHPQAQVQPQIVQMQHQMHQQQGQPPQMMHARPPPQMHQQSQQLVNMPQVIPQQQPQQLQQQQQQVQPTRMGQMHPQQQPPPQQPQQSLHPQQQSMQPTSQQHPSHGPHQPQPPPGQQQVTQPTQQATLNTMILCRYGQDIVQEIVTKTCELFNYLKGSTGQLPNVSNSIKLYEDRKSKIAEIIFQINGNFKKLTTICDKINVGTSDIDFVQPFVESLIPIVGSTDRVFDEKKKNVDVVKRLTEERNALAEQVRRKNQQVKEVIDMLRDITWDINTMLAMRKP